MRRWYAGLSAEKRRQYVLNRNPDRVKESDARRNTPARRKAKAEAARASVKKYPERQLARGRLRYAVRTGKIERLPCFKCGDPKSEGHHPDYTKALEVIWACRTHHAEIHRKPF
jgi:hypothetical protein